jgi:hypothetical protein
LEKERVIDVRGLICMNMDWGVVRGDKSDLFE